MCIATAHELEAGRPAAHVLIYKSACLFFANPSTRNGTHPRVVTKMLQSRLCRESDTNGVKSVVARWEQPRRMDENACSIGRVDVAWTARSVLGKAGGRFIMLCAPGKPLDIILSLLTKKNLEAWDQLPCLYCALY